MSQEPSRFQDENLTVSDFYQEVIVECPSCKKKATATKLPAANQARLLCSACGFCKEVSTKFVLGNTMAETNMAANLYFNASLWLQAPFKKDSFCAYNYKHLDYLEAYISASLREHKDRAGFTLLEKLPKFYHEAKNRPALLKTIQKLRIK